MHLYSLYSQWRRHTQDFEVNCSSRPHSSVLTWRIPGTGQPGRLPAMGSHRVGHDWSDLAAAAVADRTGGGRLKREPAGEKGDEDRATNQSETSYREIVWEIVRTVIDPPNHHLLLIYLVLWVRAEENT